MKPALPSQFRHVSFWAGIGYLCHGLLLWWGGATLHYALWFLTTWPLIIKCLLCMPLLFISTMGMFFTISLSHCGFHGHLHPNRFVSMALGLVYSAMPLGVRMPGYYITHYCHHRHLNSAEDPDAVIMTNTLKPLQKCFKTTGELMKVYQDLTTQIMARQIQLPETYPISVETLRRLTIWNGCWAAFFALGQCVILWFNPYLFLLACILPLIGSYIVSGLQSFLDHGGAGNDLYDSARSYISPLFTFFYLGSNYHLEHHLYPAVQIHKLPALRAYLQREAGECPIAPADLGFFRVLWQALFVKSYPMRD